MGKSCMGCRAASTRMRLVAIFAVIENAGSKGMLRQFVGMKTAVKLPLRQANLSQKSLPPVVKQN
jgi:hypothetical protein